MYQVYNSVTLREKPIEFEEFLNQIVEALGTNIDRRSMGKPRKMEGHTIEKIGCIPIFPKTILYHNYKDVY